MQMSAQGGCLCFLHKWYFPKIFIIKSSINVEDSVVVFLLFCSLSAYWRKYDKYKHLQQEVMSSQCSKGRSCYRLISFQSQPLLNAVFIRTMTIIQCELYMNHSLIHSHRKSVIKHNYTHTNTPQQTPAGLLLYILKCFCHFLSLLLPVTF